MRGIPSERVPEAPSHSARSPARRAWLPASASAASPASPDTLRGPCWSRQLCSSRLLEQDNVNELVDHRENELGPDEQQKDHSDDGDPFLVPDRRDEVRG